MTEFQSFSRDGTEHGKSYYLASEVDSHLGLVMGTLESRERNIENIQQESKRLQTEIDRLNDVLHRAKQESDLVQYNGKSVLAVPYWFLKA